MPVNKMFVYSILLYEILKVVLLLFSRIWDTAIQGMRYTHMRYRHILNALSPFKGKGLVNGGKILFSSDTCTETRDTTDYIVLDEDE